MPLVAMVAIALCGFAAALLASGVAFPGVDAAALAALGGAFGCGLAAARRGTPAGRRAGLCAATAGLAGLGLWTWLQVQAR